MRVFVAGATGAVGRRLVPMLVAEGHHVVATTRTPAKADLLRGLGADPVVVDGLDAVAMGEAVAMAEPDVVMHQMSALAGATSLRHFDREFAETTRLRTTGTDILVGAATAAGAKRIIVQSFTGWPNSRVGTAVKTEDDPLDPNPPAAQRQTLKGIEHIERVVPSAEGLDGVVLRYGMLYGPGASGPMVETVRARKMPLAGTSGGVWSWTHIDDAAAAAVRALDHGGSGVYNVVDDEPATVAEWLPVFAEAIGAKPPRRAPVWLARLAGGDVAVSMLTRVRGSSNAKARRELDWTPLWPSWREGFRRGLA